MMVRKELVSPHCYEWNCVDFFYFVTDKFSFPQDTDVHNFIPITSNLQLLLSLQFSPSVYSEIYCSYLHLPRLSKTYRI